MTDLSLPLAIAIDTAIMLVALVILQEVVRHSWRAARSGLRYGETMYDGVRGWLVRRRMVRWFREKQPRLSRFIAARFRTDGFAGLPLTLICVALFYAVMLLAGLVEELFEGSELLALDTAIFSFIAPLRTEAVLAIAGWITHFADTVTIVAVAVVVTAMLWAHGPQRFILPFWVAVLGAQLTTWLGKYTLDRSRPDFTADVPGNPSFPSGHSASAVSTYLLLAYILVRDMNPGNRKLITVYWLAVVAGLIALSRMILGVHYASDVAAGVLVGGFWVAVAVAVAELLKNRAPERCCRNAQALRNGNGGDGRPIKRSHAGKLVMRVTEGPLDLLARAGLASRGFVYVVLGLITISSSLSGIGDEEQSTSGALSFMRDLPFGTVLLFLISGGLVLFSFWRVSQSIFNSDERTGTPKDWIIRIGQLGSGLAYLGLAGFAFQLAVGWAQSSDGGSGTQSLVAMTLASAFSDPGSCWPLAPFLAGSELASSGTGPALPISSASNCRTCRYRSSRLSHPGGFAGGACCS